MNHLAINDDSLGADEIRVGIVGTDNTHAHMYAAFLNGWSRDQPVPVMPPGSPGAGSYMHLWAAALRELEVGPDPTLPIKGGRVEKIWGSDRADAARIATACSIEHLCAEPHQVCEDVDAVMILTGDSSSHLAYARPALEQGLPTYIDNPIAPDPSEAQTIFELADRHGGACFTGSALRYAAEFAVARAHAPELIGSIEAVYATSRGTFDSYIVHVLEIANHFVRDEVEELQARRVANRDTILVQYRSGQTATLEMIHPLRSQTYAILLYGPRGHHYVELTDFAQPFITLIGAFLNTARGAPPPVSASDTIYQLELVAAARESLQSGRPARAPSRGTDLSDAATWPAPRVER